MQRVRICKGNLSLYQRRIGLRDVGGMGGVIWATADT
jgi:hypothetical protein